MNKKAPYDQFEVTNFYARHRLAYNTILVFKTK
jgi:hypothetical protein